MFAFRVLVPRKKYSLHLNLPFTAACDENDAAEGTAADTAAANIFTLVKYATDAEAAAPKIAADKPQLRHLHRSKMPHMTQMSHNFAAAGVITLPESASSVTTTTCYKWDCYNQNICIGQVFHR